jgi:hypothetical protein
VEINNNEQGVKYFAVELKRKMAEHFCSLSQPVLKNIVEIVIALVIVIRTPRGWYGRLTLSGIARCMRTKGDLRSRYKRLDRFLNNGNFQTGKTVAGFFEITIGKKPKGVVPLLIDQSTIGDVQVIAASFPCLGRAIPLSIKTFEYEKIELSQNQIETDFFIQLQNTLGRDNSLLFIMDRGYANVQYIINFDNSKLLYIIRGCRNVKIEYKEEGGKLKRIGLGRLPHRQGKAKRYSNVLYHDKEKILVDIVVYRGKGFKEPWFLIVPAGSEEILPTASVVKCYRSRMMIEVKFRDFKSYLGVRGLRLKVDKAEKLERLLTCLAIVYTLLLVMGDSDLARQLRKQIEVLRKRRRHGTRRTLSVLTVALFMATDSFLLTLHNLMVLLSSILRSSINGLFSHLNLEMLTPG